MITTEGYAVHPAVLDPGEALALLAELGETPRSRAGTRHLMGHARVAALAADPRLQQLAAAALGSDAVPYRATLFDKSPRANWRVGWHQDTAVALRRRVERPGWGPWSVKDGVDYALAPAEALETLVALRVHLDDSGASNGPLRVVPGSHRHGVLDDARLGALVASRTPVECLAPRGGVVVLRPLLVHASSRAESAQRRRVLHLEYAASLAVAPGLELAVA